MDIAGQIFIVTGGASGLGEGTVRMLTEQGGRVVIADLQIERGEALAQTLGHQMVRFIRCDVTQSVDAQKVIDAATSWGTLSGLVNCAGICPAAKTLGRDGPHNLDLFNQVIQVNLLGTFNMIRLSAAGMKNNKPDARTGERGVLVSTASIAAFEGQRGQAAYAASKGGVVGMTLPIARDLASLGIRHMTIAPGVFETPMVQAMPQNIKDALARSIPFPSRLGAPTDYARLVQHIITNDMLNGEVIRLDGALRMGEP
jgi:NAD(P)-dependent dehydrogenase (short-subunit alcohol dehydrogenase family)